MHGVGGVKAVRLIELPPCKPRCVEHTGVSHWYPRASGMMELLIAPHITSRAIERPTFEEFSPTGIRTESSIH